jgi:hypothetical protein
VRSLAPIIFNISAYFVILLFETNVLIKIPSLSQFYKLTQCPGCFLSACFFGANHPSGSLVLSTAYPEGLAKTYLPF